MIVTGDRDAFQLVDAEGKVRVMATARGITETKVYDRRGRRWTATGSRPELIPDFYGLKGDTSDNIPGVPGIGDKTASQLLQQYGTLEEVLAHVDDISGKKRQENLRNHAEDARVSKVLATAQRDMPGRHRSGRLQGRRRARPLQAARDVPRAGSCATRCARLEEVLRRGGGAAPEETRHDVLAPGAARGHASPTCRRCPASSSRWPSTAPEIEEGALFSADDEGFRFGASAGGGEVLAGPLERPEALAAALGERPAAAHDAKALGDVPEVLAHDTEVAAYLLDPARRGYPLRELSEERGLGAAVDDPAAADAALLGALALIQREMLEERGLIELFEDVELPLVNVLRVMEQVGLKLDTARLAEVRERVREEAAASSARSGS